MTATAERARGWNRLRRILPTTTRPAAPEPAHDPTPAEAATVDGQVYTSHANDAGETVALRWTAGAEVAQVHRPATEPAVERSENERTRIIARFDVSPDQPSNTIPPLADRADLLPPAIYDRLMHERGLPVWDGEPTTDDDRSGELLTWETRGVS